MLSTVQGSDFLVTLNDGSQVSADVAAFSPNSDYNERAVAVLFGQFGNRLDLDDPDVLYPTRIEVVEDDTPMMLIGPDGSFVSAVGMYADAPGSPYKTPGNGPRLTGAKLTVMSAVGDGGPPGFTNFTPNDGIALYGADAQYRLRVYTTGGYTPDGVTGLKPTEYDTYFRVQVQSDAGDLVPLVESGRDYTIDGKIIQVVGLAELGMPGQVVEGNDCYGDDKDNQIDIEEHHRRGRPHDVPRNHSRVEAREECQVRGKGQGKRTRDGVERRPLLDELTIDRRAGRPGVPVPER